MEIHFSGKRALVTGAGKGIGRGCVKTLIECGAHVVALTRTQSDLDTLKEEYPSIETVCVDLSDWDKTRAAVTQILPIDLLVNNAGTCDIKPLLDVTEEDIDRIMALNLKACLNVAQVVAGSMLDRKNPGAIVNVSSVLSKVVWPNFSAYSMSKGALDQLTSSLAIELGPHGIRTNSVNPTTTMTPLVKRIWDEYPELTEFSRTEALRRSALGTLASIQDVVNQIVHLLSDRSGMVNGARIFIDGGHTIS